MPFTVFGYGSLVNRRTLPDDVTAVPGTVRGWRRAWRAPSHFGLGHGVCSLSVVPGEDEIEGLFVTFDDAHRDRIAQREHNYDALPVEGRADTVIYRAKPEIERWGGDDFPVSLSYLDTILGGFLAEFGADGAARFMDTTDGWHVPIVDDRAAPRYPRAVPLSDAERNTVDDLLQKVDARIIHSAQTGA